MGSGGGGGGVTGCSDVLVGDGLRVAVFFRAVFLRVALLVRAAALVLLAGIAITFPIVGDNRIHTIGAR